MSEFVFERTFSRDSSRERKEAEKTVVYERSWNGASDDSVKKCRRQKQPSHNWRPVFLRPLVLVSILLLTVSLIVVLQWAIIRLPHRSVMSIVHHVGNDSQHGLSKGSPGASVSNSNGNSNSNSESDEQSGTGTVKTETSADKTGSVAVETQSGVNKPAAGSEQTEAVTEKSGTGADIGGIPNKRTETSAGTGTVVKTTKVGQSTASEKANSLSDVQTSGGAIHTNTAGTNEDFSRPSKTGAYSLGSGSPARLVAAASDSAYIISHGPGTESGNQKGEYHAPLRAGGTFASSYVPTLSAVLYRMLWSSVWKSFTLVEPFRLLARPQGAPASVAFFSAYQSNPSLLECINGQKWALGVITLSSLLADILPALASESIYINTDWPDCPNRNPLAPQNPCPRRVEVLVGVVRTMQGLLIFACTVLLGLLAFFYYHHTGLASDPCSMLAVASLIGNDLREELNQIDGSVDSQGLQRLLGHTRYRLNHWEDDSGQTQFAIERDEVDIVSCTIRPSPKEEDGKFVTFWNWVRRKHWLLDSVLVFVLLGTFGVVLAYYVDYKPDGFNDFFNSGGLGPGFILTFAATLIAILWKRAEILLMVSAPYKQLAEKPSLPESTICFKPSTMPFAATVRAVQHRYFVVGAITIVVLLSNLVLNVMIGGVAYQRGQSLRQSEVSRWLSVIILTIMLIAAISLLISRLRRPRIPRQPDTLGVVMSYLAGGALLDEVQSMQRISEDERYRRIRAMQKKYQLLQRKQANGTCVWAVDEADQQSRKCYR